MPDTVIRSLGINNLLVTVTNSYVKNTREDVFFLVKFMRRLEC